VNPASSVLKMAPMKTWLAIGLAVVLGSAAGLGVALVEVKLLWPWKPSASITGATARGPGRSTQATAQVPQPKVAVDSPKYDFGVMDVKAKGKHDFVLTNKGTAPLKVSEGESTCKCTVSKVEKTEIAPGESTKVTVEWKGKGFFGDFSEDAVIVTNDPEWPRVVLTIAGRITAAVRAVPAELVFSRLTAGEPETAAVRVFGYLGKTLELTGYELADPETAEHFEVTFARLPSDQVKKEKGATGGYLVEVTVKPGLPPGPFRQTIRLATNLKDDPTVEVHVKGTLGGEISIVGRGWREETGVLSFGTVDGAEGAERTLLLIAKGPHRKEVQYKLVETFPDLLEVDEEALGQTTELRGGQITQALLKIRIPPGSRPANYFSASQSKLGRIIIETNHPTIPRLRILVRFLVQG